MGHWLSPPRRQSVSCDPVRIHQHIGFWADLFLDLYAPLLYRPPVELAGSRDQRRMAFNVVASSSRAAAANFGFDELMEHNPRYDRMEEFVDIRKGIVGQRGAGCLCSGS